MAEIWRIHQPGLYLIKYFNIRSPKEMTESINKSYAQEVQQPPAGL
jgi:hypothetical protein